MRGFLSDGSRTFSTSIETTLRKQRPDVFGKAPSPRTADMNLHTTVFRQRRVPKEKITLARIRFGDDLL